MDLKGRTRQLLSVSGILYVRDALADGLPARLTNCGSGPLVLDHRIGSALLDGLCSCGRGFLPIASGSRLLRVNQTAGFARVCNRSMAVLIARSPQRASLVP
jgi:hypothetical protein